MNKGLTTLMTVAIALVSVQAMAEAPVMADIPSPVIGNQSGVASQSTKFVYADAFDLWQMANDSKNTPSTTSTLLKWSYEIVGTPKYGINGVAPVDSSKPTTDLINPLDANNINKTLNTSPTTGETKDGDGKPNTITIRNINLAPYGGGAGNTPGAGIIDQQAVTFYCSNGAAVSSQTVMFYTDNQFTGGNPTGYNRLSGTKWKLEAMDGAIKGWVPQTDLLGSVTTDTWGKTGKGLCFNVPKLDNNMWSMQSPYKFFSLTANNVYRIRCTMNSSQGTVGKTPFWDFIVENYGTQNGVTKGLNLYGMDSFYLDNEGGANSVITTQNGTEFTMIWAPIAFQTSQWAGLYASKYDNDRHPYLRYRIMDAVVNPGLMSDQKFGQLCLQQVIVESIPAYKLMTNPNALVNITAPRAASNSNNLGNMYAFALLGSAITYPGNSVLNIQPTTSGGGADMITIVPAVNLDGKNGENITPPYTQIADDWPIAWQSGKILRMDVGMYAADSNSEKSPFDVIWLSIEPPTNEVDTESYVTANQGIASPKYNNGASQTYSFFYYTGNETKSVISQLHFLRWRIRFANSPTLNFPQPSNTTNTGSVRVTSVKVSEVTVAP